MATAHVSNPAILPEGSEVNVYLDQAQISGGFRPRDPVIDTATVTGGTVTFTGLESGTTYIAATLVDGEWQALRFTTAAPSDGSFAHLDADQEWSGDQDFGAVTVTVGEPLTDDSPVRLSDLNDAIENIEVPSPEGSTIGGESLLGVVTEAGDTVVGAGGLLSTAPAGGGYVAIGAYLDTCEIRGVVSVGSFSITLDEPLQRDHADTERIVYFSGDSFSFELAGAPGTTVAPSAATAADDQYRGLQNVLDQSMLNGLFAMGNRTRYYYTSKPLAWGSNWRMRNCNIVRLLSASVRKGPAFTLLGCPGMLDSSGVTMKVSAVDTSADEITTNRNHGYPNGGTRGVMLVAEEGATLPGGVEDGRIYYGYYVSATKLKLYRDLAQTDLVNITSAGSGDVRVYSQLARPSKNYQDDLTCTVQKMSLNTAAFATDGSGLVTKTAHGLYDGEEVRFEDKGGDLPDYSNGGGGQLPRRTKHYIDVVSDDTFKICTDAGLTTPLIWTDGNDGASLHADNLYGIHLNASQPTRLNSLRVEGGGIQLCIEGQSMHFTNLTLVGEGGYSLMTDGADVIWIFGFDAEQWAYHRVFVCDDDEGPFGGNEGTTGLHIFGDHAERNDNYGSPPSTMFTLSGKMSNLTDMGIRGSLFNSGVLVNYQDAENSGYAIRDVLLGVAEGTVMYSDAGRYGDVVASDPSGEFAEEILMPKGQTAGTVDDFRHVWGGLNGRLVKWGIASQPEVATMDMQPASDQEAPQILGRDAAGDESGGIAVDGKPYWLDSSPDGAELAAGETRPWTDPTPSDPRVYFKVKDSGGGLHDLWLPDLGDFEPLTGNEIQLKSAGGVSEYDCSTNPNYPAATRGDTYFVGVAGKIGGASGVSVYEGDQFECIAATTTAAGDQAAVGDSWAIICGPNHVLAPATDLYALNHVVKTADEGVPNSSSIQSDDELKFAAVANAAYFVRGTLRMSAASTASDVRTDLSIPGSGTYEMVRSLDVAGGTGVTPGAVNTGTLSYGSGNSTFLLVFFAYVFMSSTAGDVVLRWAQSSATVGETTTVKKGSMLEYRRLQGV